MKTVETSYTFKELNKYIEIAVFDHLDKNKGVEFKSMYDETGRPIDVILLHDFEIKDEYDMISLIIRYLDESSIIVYNSVLFAIGIEWTFDEIYKSCKENDYTEYKCKMMEDN